MGEGVDSDKRQWIGVCIAVGTGVDTGVAMRD